MLASSFLQVAGLGFGSGLGRLGVRVRVSGFGVQDLVWVWGVRVWSSLVYKFMASAGCVCRKA